MLNSLRFVQGAVARKDFVPSLVHFKIADGYVRGYNGMLSLCGPIDLDLNVTPKAVPFIKAIQTCKDTIALHLTPAGRLSVRSGAFKAFVDCIEDGFPDIAPSGEEIQMTGSILEAVKTLFPFIAEDASRPWARGILFRGKSAYATNNIVVMERWLGYEFPTPINIPHAAAAEILRIGEEPIKMQVDKDSATFHYEGGRWLRCQLYSTEWPDLGRILDQECSPVAPPEGLWAAVTDLAPFVDDLGRIFFLPEQISTMAQSDDTGAAMEIPGLHPEGCYNFKQLQLLEPIIKTIDFSTYPKPCLFFGDKVRGALVGMRP